MFFTASDKSIDSFLLSWIIFSRGVKLVDSSSPDGAEFFGLTHPSVQNLIQSLPGAKDAANYHWTKYVIAKTETAVYKPPETNPGIYYQAFVKQPANQQGLSGNTASIITASVLLHENYSTVDYIM